MSRQPSLTAVDLKGRLWHIASFYWDAEFCRYQDIADIGQAAAGRRYIVRIVMPPDDRRDADHQAPAPR
jgi:hypothetical protein